ncbi:MAG: hypothetical protein WB999_19705 [Candidatus Binataceae bacterium]
MAVDLRVVSGFVGLQVVPHKRRDRTHCDNQQRRQQDSPGCAVEPRASARGAALACGRAGQLDTPIALVVRILLESLKAARIELRIQISGLQIDSQIAIVLAIRELLSAVIFNEGVHVSPLLLAYTSIVPKKGL